MKKKKTDEEKNTATNQERPEIRHSFLILLNFNIEKFIFGIPREKSKQAKISTTALNSLQIFESIAYVFFFGFIKFFPTIYFER